MPDWRAFQVCCCSASGDCVVEYVDGSSETAFHTGNMADEAHVHDLALWKKFSEHEIQMARVEAEKGRQFAERAEAEVVRKRKELDEKEERERREWDRVAVRDKEWDELFMGELGKCLRQREG